MSPRHTIALNQILAGLRTYSIMLDSMVIDLGPYSDAVRCNGLGEGRKLLNSANVALEIFKDSQKQEKIT